MKSSILLAATGALLAMASPIEKRAMTTTVVMVWETVTVTKGRPHPTENVGEHHRPRPSAYPTEEAPEEPPVETTIIAPTTQYPTSIPTFTPTPSPEPAPTPEPEPEPITTYEPEPQPTTYEPAPPPPSTTEIPVEPTPTPEPEPEVPSDDDMEGTAIYHHNLHRSNHSAPAMTWNSEIAGYAQNSANTCVFEHDMDQGQGGYGQNLAMWGTSSDAAALGSAGAIAMATTDMWYNGEFDLYKTSFYNSEPDMSNFHGWGHFSQLLWADSTELGCAVKLCPAGTISSMPSWYMVCNYGPAGNVAGAYVQNVKAPTGGAVVTA